MVRASSPASASAGVRRSARRRIARARSSWAKALCRPGSRTSAGARPDHVAVDRGLERADHRLGDAADAVLEAVGHLGRGSSLLAPAMKRSRCSSRRSAASSSPIGVLRAEAAGHSQQRVGLVDRAVGLDAPIDFGSARRTEAGGAIVALARVDLHLTAGVEHDPGEELPGRRRWTWAASSRPRQRRLGPARPASGGGRRRRRPRPPRRVAASPRSRSSTRGRFAAMSSFVIASGPSRIRDSSAAASRVR